MLGADVFVPDSDAMLTGVALLARIRNIGDEPSIATDWSLVVTVDGQDSRAQLSAAPERLTLSGDTKRVFTSVDFNLERTTVENPVGPAPIQGRLLFYVRLPKDRVLSPDATLVLSVEDARGQTVTTSQRMRDWLVSA